MTSPTKSTAGGKAPRKALGHTKPRAEGRPYKKLDATVMQTRMADIQKKLNVHEAKSVLLRDRLTAYEREKELRQEADKNAE